MIAKKISEQRLTGFQSSLSCVVIPGKSFLFAVHELDQSVRCAYPLQQLYEEIL